MESERCKCGNGRACVPMSANPSLTLYVCVECGRVRYERWRTWPAVAVGAGARPAAETLRRAITNGWCARVAR